jgi:hypothetical protein
MLQSRAAMMSAVSFPVSYSYVEYCDNGDDDDDFPKKVARCAFRDDEEFMLKAHKSHRKYVPMCHDTSLLEPAPHVSYFWTLQLI